MARKKNQTKKPKLNPQLEGLDFNINSFGEINSNFKIDKINKFLDQNVEDKKLKNRKKEENPKSKKK